MGPTITNRGILFAIILIKIASQHLYLLQGNLYYLGDAVCWVLAFILVVRLVPYGRLRVLADVSLFLGLGNLADEIWFDPKAFEWNEYVLLMFCIIYYLQRCGVAKRRNLPLD